MLGTWPEPTTESGAPYLDSEMWTFEPLPPLARHARSTGRSSGGYLTNPSFRRPTTDRNTTATLGSTSLSDLFIRLCALFAGEGSARSRQASHRSNMLNSQG